MQTPPTNQGGMPENAGSTREELKSYASRVGNSAANKIHSELDSRKGAAASQAKSVSSAIDRAAGELDDDVPQWLRSAFRQGAEQVRRFADTIEQKDSRQLVQDVRNLARDNPGTFLAGCAALGFAAARIFKAGGAETPGQLSAQPEYSPGRNEEPMFRSWNSQPASNPTPAGDFT